MMRNHLWNRLSKVTGCLVITVMFFLQGCGGTEDTRPARNAVSGVVIYKGAPVEGAIVVFRPSGAEGQTANGRTGADGIFHMGTFEGSDGVTPGAYTVMISKIESTNWDKVLPEDDPNYDPNPKEESHPKNLLPEKYSNADTSGFTATITEGKDVTDLKFELND